MSAFFRPFRLCRLAAMLAASLGTAHAADLVRTSGPLEQAMRGAKKNLPRPLVPGVTPSLLAGATLTVTSCADDDGFDTLRHAALVANSGDTIDLTTLPCSTITLTKGEIGIGLADLSILGPGADRLAIDGGATGRVFNHVGTGQLTLSGVTVKNGLVEADKAYGGCIISKGNVGLYQSAISGCVAHGQSEAAGGGVLTYGGITATSSVISGNTATASVGVAGDLSAAGGGLFASKASALYQCLVTGNAAQTPLGQAYGGGLIAGSGFTMKYSTVSANDVASAGTDQNSGYGGGLFLFGSATIVASTVEHNSADAAGGIGLNGNAYNVAMTSSTISSNEGRRGIGALQSSAKLSLTHVTIAFNDSGAVAKVAVSMTGTAPVLNGTIIADNPGADAHSQFAITGGKNLIKIPYGGTMVPLDTIVLDPKLAPLAFNGGPTRTHALDASSPAINSGQTTSSFYGFDQRGPTYKRVVGPASDIGAFEVDADHIFGSSFGYPLVP